MLLAGLNNAAKRPPFRKLLKIHDEKSQREESEQLKVPRSPSSNSWVLQFLQHKHPPLPRAAKPTPCLYSKPTLGKGLCSVFSPQIVSTNGGLPPLAPCPTFTAAQRGRGKRQPVSSHTRVRVLANMWVPTPNTADLRGSHTESRGLGSVQLTGSHTQHRWRSPSQRTLQDFVAPLHP